MIKEILEKIADKLLNNLRITQFCTTEFTKNQTVILGQNVQIPTLAESAPAIVIAGMERTGRNDNVAQYKVVIGCAIVSSDEITSTPNKKVFNGFLLIEEFLEIVSEELLLIPWKASVEASSMPCEEFPLWCGKIILTIDKNIPMRGIPK